MKRFVFLAVLLSSSFLLSQSTTTITGTIKNLGGGNMGQGTFARFWLAGCGGNQPRINGTGIIGPTLGAQFYFDFPANSSGQISGTLYSTRDAAGTGNGSIECGGSFTSVWYQLQIFVNGKGGPLIPVHAKASSTLDISNITPITTNPVVTAPTGDSTYARLDGGNQNFTGAIGAPSVNGVVDAASQAGATLDVKLNACITAAIALPPHICDARNATGTIAGQVNVGDSSFDPVTLLLPSSGTWNVSISDGTSCAIKQFSATSIMGPGMMSGGQLRITANTGSNMSALYCTDPSPSGGSSYIRADGFTLDGRNSSLTMSSGELANVQRLFDNSTFTNIEITSYNAGIDGMRVYKACCGVKFDNITINNNGTGGNGLNIFADASGINQQISFSNMSVGHAGPNKSNIIIQGNGGSPPTDITNTGINFYNTYSECFSGVAETLVNIVDARGVHFFGLMAGVCTPANGNIAVSISQSASNQVRDIQIYGYKYGAAGCSPSCFGLSNSITGEQLMTSTAYLPAYIYGGTGGATQATLPVTWNDVAWKINTGSGSSIYNFPTTGNPTISNNADSQQTVTLNSGLTASQSSVFQFNDRGTPEFSAGKIGSNLYRITDLVNNNSMLEATQGGQMTIQSGGSAAVIFNQGTNSGTGGMALYSGGGTPSQVFSITGAGVLVAKGTAAGLTGTGACATFSNQVGGNLAGSAKCTGTTGASTVTITFGTTAPNGYVCDVWDETNRANAFQQTSHTQTTCVLTVTSVTQNDIFVFKAIAF